MQRIIILLACISLLGAALACSRADGGGSSPTEAYKNLYAAVKAKDIEAIKRQLSKKSLDFGVMAAQRQNIPVEKVVENGFTATTFSDTLPSIRDERIKDDMGAVEVWNSKESKWEDLPFVNEGGVWKLAVGDLFAGSFKSPGRGRDSLEKEAANAMTGLNPTAMSNANSNSAAVANGAPTGPAADKNAK